MGYPGVVVRLNVILTVIALLSMAQQNNSAAAPCPCDIYAAGGTPCVGAHSVVRALYQRYNGPLYQVRRASDKKTMDIYPVAPGGLASAASQDSFLSGTTGTVSIIYDQSGNNNDLTKAPAGCAYNRPDTEATATGDTVMVGGYKVYGLYQGTHRGYRKDTANSLATGNKPEGMYWVVNGKHYNSACCFDYGNAETNNCGSGGTGTMAALNFGTECWFSPCQGNGPWIFADLEGGLFAGGTGVNSNNTPVAYNYVTGMLKSSTTTYTIRAGNAQSGTLKTMWDGNLPAPEHLQGSLILGIGGDNSGSGVGTFYEGAMTSGRPPDTTEDAVQRNIVAAGYGQTTAIKPDPNEMTPSQMCLFKVRYNPSNANAVISYALQDAGRVIMNIFDINGRHIAAIVNGVIPVGLHEAIWDAKRVPTGIYIWKIAIDGRSGGSGRIVIGK